MHTYLHNVDLTFEDAIVVTDLDPLDLRGTITHLHLLSVWGQLNVCACVTDSGM